jgi:hypothetical protein
MAKEDRHNSHENAGVAAGAQEAVSHAADVSTDTIRKEGPGIATAALLGVGVAILEPELIPGILIGAGAMLAPKILPAMAGVFRPLLKGAVRAGYGVATTVREAVAEASEHVEDIVAEAKAEHHHGQPRAGGSEAHQRAGNRSKPHPQVA